MRTLVAILILFVAHTCPVCDGGNPSESIVKVEVGSSRLSGVVVHSDGNRVYVATNAHAFHAFRDDNGQIRYAGEPISAYSETYPTIAIDRILYVGDPDNRDADPGNNADLAILAGASTNPPPPAVLADKEPASGDEVHMVGFRSGTGRIESVLAQATGAKVASYGEPLSQFNRPSPQGTSGGGVFFRGRLAALRSCSDGTTSTCVPLSRLRSVIHRIFPRLSGARLPSVSAPSSSADSRTRHVRPTLSTDRFRGNEPPTTTAKVTEPVYRTTPREPLSPRADTNPASSAYNRARQERSATPNLAAATSDAVAPTVIDKVKEVITMPSGFDWTSILAVGLSAAGVTLPVPLVMLWRQRKKLKALHDLVRGRDQQQPDFDPNNPYSPGTSEPYPIGIPAKPIQQPIYPQPSFYPVEKDTHAKAFDWACGQIVREYPGSAADVERLQALIQQFIAAYKKEGT